MEFVKRAELQLRNHLSNKETGSSSRQIWRLDDKVKIIQIIDRKDLLGQPHSPYGSPTTRA